MILRTPSRPAYRSQHGVAAVLAVLGVLLATLWPAVRADAASVPGDAWVRAAHLVPGLGGMQVLARPVDGGAPVVLAADAGYGDVAPYARLAPGAYSVELRPAGAAADSAPVLSSTLTAEAGDAYTVAGLGSLQAPRLATLSDDLTPPPAGSVSVRLLPAAAAAAEVSVKAQNGPVIADDAAFGQPTGYLTVPAGTWTLDASAAGLPTASTTVDLAAGGVYTVAVVDRGGALGVQAVTDAVGMAAMPVGGAQTGGGGTAPAADGTSAAAWTTAAAGFVLLAGAGLLARRRHAPRRTASLLP